MWMPPVLAQDHVQGNASEDAPFNVQTMKSEIMHLRQEVDRLRRDEIARCQAHQVGMAPPQVVSAYHERAMRLVMASLQKHLSLR